MPKCVICGKTFKRRGRQRSCGSPECKLAVKRMVRQVRRSGSTWERTDRKCAICGKMFTPLSRKQVCCDDLKCKVERQKIVAAQLDAQKREEKPKERRACAQCGREFEMNRPHQKYCTQKCAKAWALDHKTLKQSVCLNCGKEFITDRGASGTCSIHCYKEWKDEQRRRMSFSPDCPFAVMETYIPGASWSDPIMGAWDGWQADGVWVCVEERERRIAA